MSSFALIMSLFNLVDFYDTHVNDITDFSKADTWILRSFDFYSVLTRQTSEKVASKSGFDIILEYFLPSTFA